MSLLSKKQKEKRDEEERFRQATKRTAFTAILLLLFMTAIVGLVALIMFYTLNCTPNRDAQTERANAVEQYSLTQASAGGCSGPPMDLFVDSSGTTNSVLYLIGNGDVKPWQYVGDFPIYLHFHQGGMLKIHLLDAGGNLTTEVLGDVKVDSETSMIVKLPARSWHAWEPENLYPLTVLSVITSSGTSDFTQHPLTDIYTDPVLGVLTNQSDARPIILKYAEGSSADYCQTTS